MKTLPSSLTANRSVRADSLTVRTAASVRLMPLWSLLQVLLVLLASLCMVAPADGAQRELKVGVYQNPPKIFFDHAGQASGIHIDLLRQIADREGWQLRFVPCDWQACLRGVQSGLIDLLPDVAYSEERDKLFQFSTVPALYSWSILYRNPRVTIQSVFAPRESCTMYSL